MSAPPGPGKQPGGDGDRLVPRRRAWCISGLGRLHPAIRLFACTVRAAAKRDGTGAQRLAPWPQAHRRGDRGASRMEHGPKARHRPQPGYDRRACGRRRPVMAKRACASADYFDFGTYRHMALPRLARCAVPARGRGAIHSHCSRQEAGHCRSGGFLWAAGDPPAQRLVMAFPRPAAVRRFLPGRFARIRRRPRRAPAAGKRSRAAGMDRRSGFPRRIRRGSGGSRAAVHVRLVFGGGDRRSIRGCAGYGGDFFTGFSARHRGAPVLEPPARHAEHPPRAARRQRRGGRDFARRPVQSDLDLLRPAYR